MQDAFKFILILGTALWATMGWTAPIDSQQALSELKTAKHQVDKRLTEIEVRLKSLVNPDPNTDLASDTHEDREIRRLMEERQENRWRQALFDRLIFQVASNFKEGDLRIFLSERLAKMASDEVLDPQSPHDLWDQMRHLSRTLHRLPERGDNVVALIQKYLQTSPFKKPIDPDEFLRARQYTNGRDSVAAAPVDKEKVGELVEQRVRELEEAASAAPAPSPPPIHAN